MWKSNKKKNEKTQSNHLIFIFNIWVETFDIPTSKLKVVLSKISQRFEINKTNFHSMWLIAVANSLHRTELGNSSEKKIQMVRILFDYSDLLWLNSYNLESDSSFSGIIELRFIQFFSKPRSEKRKEYNPEIELVSFEVFWNYSDLLTSK